MNIEKLIMTAMLCFVSWSAVYIGVSRPEPRLFGRKHVESLIERTPDFNLETVIDNKPFNSYYIPDKRNPFVPVQYSRPETDPGNTTAVTEIDPDIKWPWTFPKKPDPGTSKQPDPVPDPRPPVYDNTDIPVVNIPNKPDPNEKPEIKEVKPAEDSGVPVELIGFAKTEGGGGRKAILGNTKTGEVFTVTEGEHLSGLDMEVVTITPFSIIIKTKTGEKVEFVNDILKEAHQSDAKSQ